MLQKNGSGFKLTIPRKKPVVTSTFRLSEEGHKALKKVAKAMGLKYAEVFGRLLLLFEALESTKDPITLKSDKKVNRVRKTYVVNKETLVKLSLMVKNKKTTRDLLIEKTALRFSEFFEENKSAERKSYQSVHEKIIKPFWSQSEDIERKLSKKLGHDDPIVTRFGYVVTILMSLSMAIESFLNDDRPIDPHDFSQS